MIAIVNYGAGNLFSLCSSLDMIGVDTKVTSDPCDLITADKIILPGVSAFEDAIRKLRESGMCETLCEQVDRGKKLMGICLGMQMLFERSFEYGTHTGLGFLKGDVTPMSGRIPDTLKIPQMGWNALNLRGDHPILKYTREGDYVYFVHSYSAVGCEDSLIATTEYGADITAAVGLNNVCGTQFHPEISGRAGLNILRAFAEW